MGGIAALAGGSLLSDGELMFGMPLAVSGIAATLSSIAVRRRRKWGVPMMKLVSVVCLLYIPIGTILGYYFLRHVGKVRHLLS